MNTILITGGTGFLGHALVERLLRTDVEAIRIFSRNEGNQAAMRIKFPDSRLRFLLGDVRDRSRVRRAMDDVEGVIHAAALKRIENGLNAPFEMIQTNELGSYNVAEAARECGVKSVVLVSSDKAFAPVSTYGNTKANAEQIFLGHEAHRRPHHPHYHIVRYGNVWGSTGSVVPKWRAISASGGLCEVTDPAATRFFMLGNEAVDFVLDALYGKHPPGLVAVPNWLPAYDLKTLLEAAGIEKYRVKGLPWFEKLHESMAEGLCSKDARRMTVEELRGHLGQS